MAMKVYECEQGSELWHTLRAGVLTASNMKIARQLVMASGVNKGKPGEKCTSLAFRIAIERIAGAPLQDDKFETYAMRRGHELEPEARAAHEKLGIVVRKAGFVTTADGRIGASVDGMLDPKGISEYKCLVSPDGLREILVDNDLSDFEDQMQTGLMVSERDYCHFGLYCPALAPIGRDFTLRVVWRNDVYIKALERDAKTFLAMVDEFEDRLRNGTEAERVYLEKALA